MSDRHDRSIDSVEARVLRGLVSGAVLVLVLVLVLALVAVASPALASGTAGAAVAVADSADTSGMSSSRLGRLDASMQGYVDRGEVPGIVTLILRRGELVHLQAYGSADLEAGLPMRTDTLFRLASMTKPITSVAVLMLYERGHFVLNDPVSKLIPELASPRVLVADGEGFSTRPAGREITIRQLLNHTSGIGYQFFAAGPGEPHSLLLHVAQLYERAGVSDGLVAGDVRSNRANMMRLAQLPLMHEPGERWSYSLATDVLGYLVEVATGIPLEQFVTEQIFTPLGMKDTHFHLPAEKAARLPPVYAGGGGLVSTAHDYARFAQMLLQGGELDGVRLLSRKTIEAMTSNQIGDDHPLWRNYDGDRFGLGVSIRTERGEYDEIESLGSYGWGGLFNTHFWVDPQEEMVGVFMSQLFPAEHLRVREQFRVLANQAIID